MSTPHETTAGEQQFRLYGDRGFSRLQDMVIPDGSTDYVDIYFDLQTARAWVD